MNLAIFLSTGESFEDMDKRGQGSQFRKFYLKAFSQNFDLVYIFSYSNEKVKGLPDNVFVIKNKFSLPRYIYALLLPILERNTIKTCTVIRTYHISATPPAIISKIIYNIPFVFNYAYDYKKVARLERKYPQILFFTLVEPFAKFFANKIFVASKEISTGTKKEIFLPNGVDTEFYKPQKVKKKGNMILTIGRLESQKNFESLIKAIKGLNVELVIVGSGKLKKKLIQDAKKQKVNLKIIDRLENTRLPSLYNKADIFVLPSLIEGSPKSLLEAMSCSIPPIGTNVMGIREIIKNKNNGLLAKVDSESLSKKIKYLITNPSVRLKLGKNARGFIEKNYDLKNLIKIEISTIKNAAT
ncbi:MAG: glycosyltransferase family 4 protein [Candidatus Curtissbacteria bacterium]|nr:glycosyltransferase family 4 protein [Candidatus Curtissbacteria bacterium]